VGNRNLCLVQTFCWCAFLCAVLGLLGVGAGWYVVGFDREVCRASDPLKGMNEREFENLRDTTCDGKDVKQAVITGTIITTIFGVLIALLQCTGGYFSQALIQKGAFYFSESAVPVTGAVVGAPVYVPAQSAAQVYVVDSVVVEPPA
jgi:uncharacterized membrane protein